ncbi:hypothetical protein FVB32_10300 [Flagellimonas hymeniacidonis]|uniref:DUF2490 domain-containing protein n=1 Tax=Flagellimonas hymeniacidonis TaxID=2603628 RepID=A0A5C8V1F3_9FLAO|nr:hypothetical protein [Flagellimonas hymeniacidonis]TXN34979.1 hypothetical protein FVB32_10300 [Flagellimonas hymeniacidonis]
MRFSTVILITLLVHLQIHAQDEFFHEIELRHEVYDGEKWALDITGNWKNLYEEEAGWRRWGANATLNRKFGEWSIIGGFAGFFTFNSEIDNFFELRPHIAVRFNLPLLDRLSVAQRLRTEWRSFLYTQGETENESYQRLRYRIGTLYTLAESEEEGTAWRVWGNIEWFFLRDPALGERFPSSREYALRFIREFRNGNELGLGYKLENFFDNPNQEGNTGHIIILEFRF